MMINTRALMNFSYKNTENTCTRNISSNISSTSYFPLFLCTNSATVFMLGFNKYLILNFGFPSKNFRPKFPLVKIWISRKPFILERWENFDNCQNFLPNLSQKRSNLGLKLWYFTKIWISRKNALLSLYENLNFARDFPPIYSFFLSGNRRHWR